MLRLFRFIHSQKMNPFTVIDLTQRTRNQFKREPGKTERYLVTGDPFSIRQRVPANETSVSVQPGEVGLEHNHSAELRLVPEESEQAELLSVLLFTAKQHTRINSYQVLAVPILVIVALPCKRLFVPLGKASVDRQRDFEV